MGDIESKPIPKLTHREAAVQFVEKFDNYLALYQDKSKEEMKEQQARYDCRIARRELMAFIIDQTIEK